jgi:TonB family protein
VLQDRRRHTRQLVTPHLYVALNSSASGGILTDVSEGGMALNLLGPPVSDDVLLDLNLPESSEHFQTKGQITWTKNSERRVGLKFVDLTESSLLQIKKWLAISPVTTELKQNLQSERNEPGTNVRDTEAAEAGGSGAIALNLETTAQPTGSRAIDIPGPKHVQPQNTEAKAVRNAIPTVDLHTEREEPLTSVPETQTLEGLRSPAVASDHGAWRLREIKESLAKKSGTAEFQNVLVSAGANDPERVKIKTLEAPFTEAQRVHADIPNPALRGERKEPSTEAQETQLAEAPLRASAGILPSDRMLQRKLRPKSSVPVDLEPNVPIQDSAKNGSSVHHRERPLEKIAEPVALGTIGVTKTTSAEVDVKEPKEVLFAAPGPELRSEKKAPTTTEQAVQAPKFPTSLTAASEQGDKLAKTLRTSFARSELHQVREPLIEQKIEEVAVDRVVLRRWIFASVVVFLLIVLLAAARWIYTSPIFDKIASASDLREMIARVFSSGNGPQTGSVAHNVDSQETHPQLRQQNGSPENDEMRPDGPSVREPRMSFDAQKRHKVLSQVSTAMKGSSALGEKNQVSEVQPTGYQTQQQVGTQVGHVSLHAAANLPEKIILPAYPAVAWQKNVQGRVTLNALISKDGRLRKLRLVGPPSLLSGSVLGAVKKWRYQPRMENGMPVEVETQIAVDFEK